MRQYGVHGYSGIQAAFTRESPALRLTVRVEWPFVNLRLESVGNGRTKDLTAPIEVWAAPYQGSAPDPIGTTLMPPPLTAMRSCSARAMARPAGSASSVMS